MTDWNNLHDYFIEYLFSEKSISHNTINSYSCDISHFKKHLCGKIKDINPKNIRSYIRFLHDSKYANSTISRRISSIKQFISFISQECDVSCDVTKIESPKNNISLPKSLSQEEIDSVFQYLNNNKSNEHIRFLAILEMLYSSGIRISELLSIRMFEIQNVTEQNNQIIIQGKGNKERVVFLNKSAISAVKEYINIRNLDERKSQSKWLFPGDIRGRNPNEKKQKDSPTTRQRLNQIFHSIAIKCNLNPKKFSPHVIRHSFATHLLQNDANIRVVQELLGHENLSTTQRYTKILNSDLKNKIFAKHPIKNMNIKI